MLFASIHSALGYVANDWGDRTIDKLQGKPNAFINLSYIQGIFALSILLVIALLSGLPFINRPAVIPLWGAWIFFALAYSLKPLRLKECGIWGLGFSAIAQWTLPVLLAFAAFERFGEWDMIIFVMANTISGATLEIAHQRYDRSRDISTQTNTLGTRLSSVKVDRLYTLALIFDKLALGSVLITICIGISSISQKTIWIALSFPLIVFYIITFLISFSEIRRSLITGEFLDPYYSINHSANKVLHETIPNFIIPTYLLFILTILQPANGILLLVFLYYRIVLGQADWRWPLHAVQNLLSRAMK